MSFYWYYFTLLSEQLIIFICGLIILLEVQQRKNFVLFSCFFLGSGDFDAELLIKVGNLTFKLLDA